MYTSAELLKKHLLFNLSGTLFLVLFGAVYESFSHGVYSYFMLYAFAIPLVFGVTLYAVLLCARKHPNRVFLNLWNAAIATFSAGSVFQGVLEIYGTTDALVIVYPIAGTVLAIASFAAAFIGRRFSRPARRTPPYRKTKSPAP